MGYNSDIITIRNCIYNSMELQKQILQCNQQALLNQQNLCKQLLELQNEIAALKLKLADKEND